MSLLNAVLGESEQISDFHFVSTAYAAKNPDDRGIVLDLQCKTTDGRRFVIELQKRRQIFFRERTLFYATWPIQSQGQRGQWNYNINAVYVISILDFLLNPHSHDNRIVTRKMIQDVDTHETWTDKLCFINIEIQRFTKPLNQCATQLDKWFFILKNLHSLLDKPIDWQEEVFRHLFEVSDKSNLDENNRTPFEESETEYNTMKNALDFAIQDGIEQGIAQGIERGIEKGIERGLALDKIEVIEGMLANGCEWDFILKITHVDEAGFAELKRKFPSKG
jgi:predicted transposase/invertase (TIGR01784 family)